MGSCRLHDSRRAAGSVSYQVRINANVTKWSATAMTSLLVIVGGSRFRGNDGDGTEWVSAARMLSRSNALGMEGEGGLPPALRQDAIPSKRARHEMLKAEAKP